MRILNLIDIYIVLW